MYKRIAKVQLNIKNKLKEYAVTAGSRGGPAANSRGRGDAPGHGGGWSPSAAPGSICSHFLRARADVYYLPILPEVHDNLDFSCVLKQAVVPVLPPLPYCGLLLRPLLHPSLLQHPTLVPRLQPSRRNKLGVRQPLASALP